ncbi:hypothetical protein MRX96_021314 [Rhipicephalus microplus]
MKDKSRVQQGLMITILDRNIKGTCAGARGRVSAISSHHHHLPPPTARLPAWMSASAGREEYCCSLCSCGFGTTAYVAVKMRLGKKLGKRIEILFWCPGPKARRPRRSLYRLPGCLTPFYAAACRACMGMLALEDTVLCTQLLARVCAMPMCGAAPGWLCCVPL